MAVGRLRPLVALRIHCRDHGLERTVDRGCIADRAAQNFLARGCTLRAVTQACERNPRGYTVAGGIHADFHAHTHDRQRIGHEPPLLVRTAAARRVRKADRRQDLVLSTRGLQGRDQKIVGQHLAHGAARVQQVHDAAEAQGDRR